MNKFKVGFIVTQIDPHDDELLAICILRRFATHIFIGIREAKIQLLDAGKRARYGGDGYHWLLRGFVCIGVLGGKIVKGQPCLDEHALPKAERKNNSAATLAAKEAGVQNDPGLMPMLAYSLKADVDGYSDPFELGNLVKALHVVKTHIDTVVEMYQIGFNALYAVFSGAVQIRVLVPFSRLVDTWKFKKFGGEITPEQEANLVEINELARRKDDKAILKPFSLIGLTHAMLSAGVPFDTVEQIVFRYLDAKYTEYEIVNRMKKDFAEDAKYLEVTAQMPYSVAVIKTDSELMKRAAHKADPTLDVLIQILSTGHVRVFNLNKSRFRNLNFVAARLRRLVWISMPNFRGKVRMLSMDQLMAPDTLPEIEEIHNFSDQGHVLNGSNTAIDKPPLIGRHGRTEKDVVGASREGLELHAKHVMSR